MNPKLSSHIINPASPLSPREDLNLITPLTQLKSPTRSPRLVIAPTMKSPIQIQEQTELEQIRSEIVEHEAGVTTTQPIEQGVGMLPMLSVDHEVGANRSAINDDTYAPLRCTWYDNLVRIACIGEGSCFIHAVLKGFFREYQENKKAKFRLQTAAAIRRDLAILLAHENPRYQGHTYWETIADGAFPRMVMQEIKDESLIEVTGVDYSLNGMQRMLNSTYYLGDEIYNFISDIFNIDVYIFHATHEDITHHSNTRRYGNKRDAVMIVGNGAHYEVVAVDTLAGQQSATPRRNPRGGFQTLFPPDDPFVLAIIRKFNLNWIERPFDPDQTFINNIIDIFTETEDDIGLFYLPPVIEQIFLETDRFRIILAHLTPRIREELAERDIKIRISVIDRLNQIIEYLQKLEYSQNDLDIIRQLIQDRIDPNNPHQTMDSIIDQLYQEKQLHNDTIEVLRTINQEI